MTQTFDVKFGSVLVTDDSFGFCVSTHAEATTAAVLKLIWLDVAELLVESWWTSRSKIGDSIVGHWYFYV